MKFCLKFFLFIFLLTSSTVSYGQLDNLYDKTLRDIPPLPENATLPELSNYKAPSFIDTRESSLTEDILTKKPDEITVEDIQKDFANTINANRTTKIRK